MNGPTPRGRVSPTGSTGPRTGGVGIVAADDLPQLSSCDVEPEMFRVFSFAVLALHRPMGTPRCGVAMCSCGKPTLLCQYTSLANQLLYSPAPDAPSSGTG